MKREGFWRDVTPPLNIYGVPPAVYHDLPAVVSVSVKNDILGVQRHSAVFLCYWDIPAGQSAPSVYVCTACFRVSRHQDVPWWYRHRTELPREWHGPE